MKVDTRNTKRARAGAVVFVVSLAALAAAAAHCGAPGGTTDTNGLRAPSDVSNPNRAAADGGIPQ
jgi:hypothetical protein